MIFTIKEPPKPVEIREYTPDKSVKWPRKKPNSKPVFKVNLSSQLSINRDMPLVTFRYIGRGK